jgi:pimeloyl-ACP methyl ester carboxylesterase
VQQVRDVDVRRLTVPLGEHVLAVREAGPLAGQPIVLVHGLASDSGTWEPAMLPLARHGLRVIAPDLLGHGDSDKPAVAGYSLDGFAILLRDLMDALDTGPGTLVGHSLGGAIAMHFAFHDPGYTARLVLVASGGLGKEVHAVLRAAALPIAPPILRALLNPRTERFYRAPRLHRTLRLTPENVVNLRRATRTLITPGGRQAFFTTLRSVIEPSGQRGSMIEMQYLADHNPTLIVWSEEDNVIPVAHALELHRHLPSSRLELFPGRGHEPHRRHAARFADVVADFVATTVPATGAPHSEPR